MNHGSVSWPVRAEIIGPCDEIEVLDATWQGAPEWSPEDRWVATGAPDLVYPGPPFPGLLIKVDLPAGDCLDLQFARQEPDDGLTVVFSSELTLGKHGLYVHPGSVQHLPLQEGNYPLSVWMDSDRPEQVRRCVVVLGEQRPSQLGAPRSPSYE